MFYPLSCLRGLKYATRMMLVNTGIVIIKQLLDADVVELARKAGLPEEVVRENIEKAQASIRTLI